MKTKSSFLCLFFAWSVHLLTASGAFLGFLACLYYSQEEYRLGTLCILLAVLIDSVDGFFARLVKVRQVIPHFNGALLDNIVDFNNYSFVPLLMLWRSGLAGEIGSYFIIIAILLASLYQFCQENAKTDDHFFLGFPSYWNIVIIYLYWLNAGCVFNLSVLFFFVVVSFMPIKFLYPSRSRYFRFSSLIICLSAFLLFAYIIVFTWSEPSVLLLWLIFLLFLCYCLLSLLAHKRSRNK